MSFLTAALFDLSRHQRDHNSDTAYPNYNVFTTTAGGREYTPRNDTTAHSSGSSDDPVRWNVVKQTDAQRGFRLFDGLKISIRDVSSEELFLERMRIAYSAFDAYVSPLVDRSPVEIARGVVKGVSACLTKYFSTQSMLRTNRPLITKVLNLDCPDMFCSHSDFVKSYLFTNSSSDDAGIIEMAEKVFQTNNFNVCGGVSTTTDTVPGGASDEEDRLFQYGISMVESNILGGTHTSYTSQRATGGHYTSVGGISDGLPFQQQQQHNDGSTAAMLIVVTDFEALSDVISYILFLTPIELHRRYNVDFDCLQRPSSKPFKAGLECCRLREGRKRKRDETKVVIRSVIEKKRREKIDTMAERRATCQATLQQRVSHTTKRNRDLLCHLLLMLFDKCLGELIDRGFENLNARRGYAVQSAKEIGTATVYSGIIDTVGELSANVEGYTFENLLKSAATRVGQHHDADDDGGDTAGQPAQIRFSLPLSTIISSPPSGGGKRRA